MQSKHGIQIDVLNANTPNRIPLNMLLEGGLTLVKMPHGPFKVRVITPHPSDVTVTLDANQLTFCQVPAGITELAMGKDGRPFAFKAADATADGAPAASAPVETDGFEPDVDPELLAKTVLDGVVGGEEALKQITQPPHVTGLLLVSVRFTEQAPIPGIVPPPYDTDELAFQMNPPAEHNGMVAANFHKIVPPEKIERRWCSCCRRLDDR